MLRALIYWAWNLKPEQIIFTSQAEADCLRQAQEMSQVYGYAVVVPLITLSDCRNNLARIAAAFAILLVSADEHFTRLVIEPKHIGMATQFLDRLYSHDNCSLDEHSEIMRMGSQLLDYDQIKEVFEKKVEQEKHAPNKQSGQFARLIFLLRINHVIRRDDLSEQAGCTIETIKRVVRLLKRFNLLDTTQEGYVKRPKFNKFLRRFMRERRDFFEGVMWGSGSNSFEDNEIDDLLA